MIIFSEQIQFLYRGCLSHYCCQFDQHFTSSFYKQRSQKRKKYSKAISLFALLGSVCVEAALKMLVKFTPRGN